jgi:hypothetical protein
MAVVDAEGAVKTWLDANSSLTGPGTPLPKGVQLHRLRSPYQGAYVLLRRVGGSAAGPQGMYDRARLSALVFGVSKEGAAAAAIAYTNVIDAIRTQTPMGNLTCEYVSNISGPSDATTNQDEPRYNVDADFYFHA